MTSQACSIRRRPCRAHRAFAYFALIVGVFFPIAVDAQTAPAGWSVTDVGAATMPGYATLANEVYVVSGTGTGFKSRADELTFVYQKLTGDGVIVARVLSLQNTSRDAKAGVMIRQTLAGDSVHASLVVKPKGGIVFNRRVNNGGRSAVTAWTGSLPVWLKLERTSAAITASWSSNGSTWEVLESVDVPMKETVYVGLATTSGTEVAPAEARFSNVEVRSPGDAGGSLPPGWRSEDIGAPRLTGAATYEAGTFTVTGGGRHSTGTLDQFHFAHTHADGDLDIVARVRAFGQTTPSAQAGVMIRDSLTPDGAHVAMFVTPSDGTTFRYRRKAGGRRVYGNETAIDAPVWIKLSLRGGLVTGYLSGDGVSWIPVRTEALTLPSPFVVGLAVMSGSIEDTATAEIDNVSVKPVAQTENAAPAVSLVEPSEGARYATSTSIVVRADATDTDGTIARVEFYAGSTLIGSDSTAPYAVDWKNAPAGSHRLTAVAIDDEDASTTSGAVTVAVETPNQPPSVSLAAPTATSSGIALSATAADADGTVMRVDFYEGTTLIGSATAHPYAMVWNNLSAGTYSFRAVAMDDDGATTTSSSHTQTIDPPAVPQRRAVFNPSPEHDTLVISYRLEIFAAGADPSTAVPMASQDLGKPAVVNGECSADVTATIEALPAGQYQAVVASVGTGGTSRSAPVGFTR